MNKNLTLLFVVLWLFFGPVCLSQNKLEREHRIKRSQFPVEALQFIFEYNDGFKRLKYYKEVDGSKNRFTAKFKKDRLFYEVDFNEKGELSGAGIVIKKIDIPEESMHRISAYLSQNFDKVKVRKMSQAYLSTSKEDHQIVMKNAFQNLMLPDMVYEFFIKGKNVRIRTDFEITFDAHGNYIHSRVALPPNYDRVLY